MPLLKLSAETIAASRPIEPGLYKVVIKKIGYKTANNEESANYIVDFSVPALARVHRQWFNEEWLQIGMVNLVEALRDRPFAKGEEIEIDTDSMLEREVMGHFVLRPDKHGNIRAQIDRFESVK